MDGFLRLLDDASADERRSARRTQRVLQQAGEDGATLVGTLLDLVERGTAVTLRTSSGRNHSGALVLVAGDFCVVRTAAGDVWVAFAGLTTIRPTASEWHGSASGNRTATDLLLLEALLRVVDERPRLAFLLDGGELLAGELRAVGADVLTIRLEGLADQVVYVSGRSVRAAFRSG